MSDVETLYDDQCPKCHNFGVEVESAGPMAYHCPDCGNDWWILPDEDDE